MKSTSLTLAAGLCLASFTTASLAQQAGSNPDANSQPNDREAAASAVDPTLTAPGAQRIDTEITPGTPDEGESAGQTLTDAEKRALQQRNAAASGGEREGNMLGNEAAPSAAGGETGEMQSAASQRGYALGSTIGMRIAADFREMQIDVDPDAVAKGVRDALAGESKMTEEQIAEVMMNLQQEAEQKMAQQQQQQAQEAGAQNQQWLEQNAAGEGWQTTESGLQYKVVEEGEGESPTEADRVKVHYTGTLTDGTKFDSSRDRGEPAVFGVGQVIPGWTEALKMMKPGARYKLAIPADLGYGMRGTPSGTIPPNSILLFDVELLEVNPDSGM